MKLSRRAASTAALLFTGALTVVTVTACGSNAHPSAAVPRDALAQTGPDVSAVSTPTFSGSAPAATPVIESSSASQPSTSRATPDGPGPTSAGTPVATTTPTASATPVAAATPGSPALDSDAMQVVDSAWLSAAEMPAGGYFQWTRPDHATASTNPAMFGIDRVFPMCVAFDPGAGHGRWVGAQELDFSSDHGKGSQIIMIYPDAASAHAAYERSLSSCDGLQNLTRDWQAHPLGSAQIPVDATVAQTGVTTDGSAWSRHWTGFASPSSVAGAQINHQYIAQRGVALTAVSFDEGPDALPATPYDTTGDLNVLRTIASRLCHYGGACS